jgi:hypothetical protein
MMFKKLLSKLIGKVIKSDAVADVIADQVDDVIMDVADAHTGGLVSKAEAAVKKHRRDKRGRFSKQ